MSEEQRLSEADQEALATAVQRLEFPSLTARLTELVGMPLEAAMRWLPGGAVKTINAVSEKALHRALKVSLASMGRRRRRPSPGRHKIAAAVAGAAGGAVGLWGLAAELPITTAFIFRSIADIARAEGEDLNDPETALACLQVFALGGPRRTDDSADSIYFGARLALAQSVHEAARYLARGVTQRRAAPVLVRMIAKVASRFGVVVSYKATAQLVPLIGAAGGSAINTVFMQHFQNMARGHFTIRRLERTYGADTIRQAYSRILTGQKQTAETPDDDDAGGDDAPQDQPTYDADFEVVEPETQTSRKRPRPD